MIELWGFESSKDYTGGKFALLQMRVAGAGANATNDVPPPHQETMPTPPEATSENTAQLTSTDPANNHNEQRFYVEFQGQRNQNGHLTPNPNQRWSYRGVWHERDAVLGISCREEAEEVQEFIDRIDPGNQLRRLDPNAQITYLTPDDNDPDNRLNTRPVALQTVLGRTGNAPEINNQAGVDGNDNHTPSTPAEMKRQIARLLRELDALAALIANGSGDVDQNIFQALQRLDRLAKLTVNTQYHHLITTMRSKIQKINELQERRAGIMRQSTTGASQASHAQEIARIDTQISNLQQDISESRTSLQNLQGEREGMSGNAEMYLQHQARLRARST